MFVIIYISVNIECLILPISALSVIILAFLGRGSVIVIEKGRRLCVVVFHLYLLITWTWGDYILQVAQNVWSDSD